MTTQTIRNGTSIDVPIPTGQTLKVVAVTGTYTITVTRGTGIGTALATAATGGSYGAYAYDSVVRIVASSASEIDFDVAVTPSVATDTVANYSFDSTGAVTGLVGPVGVVVGAISAQKRSNVMSFSLGGFLGAPVAVVTNPYSVMLQTVLEAEYDTVRVGIFNADTASVAGVKVAIGAGDTLTDTGSVKLGLNTSGQPNNSLSSGFVNATFGGAATGTLTASALASTGASGANIGGCTCAITWTDWMSVPSIARADGSSGLPVINAIVTWPATVNRTQMKSTIYVRLVVVRAL